ncbi:MAG: hypothetical protein ACPG4T_08085 [Nannocystaceae bacterium]
MSIVVIGYILYLLISIALTMWVARTLHRNGRVFLVNAFRGEDELADSVNHLLVVGFYLINIGFVTLNVHDYHEPETIQALFEVLSPKIGVVLLTLGAMHFFNMFVFSRMRKRAQLMNQPPPVAPTGLLQPAPVPYRDMVAQGQKA